MSADSDLINLRSKLQALVDGLHGEISATADTMEQKRLRATVRLPQLTMARIDAYLAGDRHIAPANIIQSTIGDCTRGFAEISANATEGEGHIHEAIREILDFCVMCRRSHQ